MHWTKFGQKKKNGLIWNFFPTARLDGVLSADISVSSMDINQCDAAPESSGDPHQIVDHFMGSHKCDNLTSRVSHDLAPP